MCFVRIQTSLILILNFMVFTRRNHQSDEFHPGIYSVYAARNGERLVNQCRFEYRRNLFLSGLAVAIHKGLCGHGFFAFGLKLVNGDKVAILAFDHEWGNDAAHDRWVADNGCRANNMGF